MKIITLGCSLTHQAGWADYIAECTKLPLVNLAQSAGSNQIQQHRFREYALTDTIDSSDLIIWQITSTHRKHGRIKLDNEWRLTLAKELYVPETLRGNNPTITKRNKNLFDNNKRIDFLCVSDNAVAPKDEEQLIEDLLFHLVTAKKFSPNLLVIFGWDRVLPPQYLQKFKDFLVAFNIEYIEDTIVDWCEARQLTMAGTKHPTHRSYQIYGEQVIMPKINSMLGTEFNIISPWSI
jgi:hypothetical protein